MQGGTTGPLVTSDNVYKKLEKLVQAMGMHSVEPYYSDPSSPKMEAKMAQAGQAKPPDPQVALLQVQQQVEAAKAQNDQQKIQIDAADKAADQQLAQRKQTADEQFKARELAIREREAAIKEAELGIKNSEVGIKADIERAKLDDGREARIVARQASIEDAQRASMDAAMTPTNGGPHPLEILGQGMQQQSVMLAQLAAAIERMARPKAGRMVKRQDGVWDFSQGEAPGSDRVN